MCVCVWLLPPCQLHGIGVCVCGEGEEGGRTDRPSPLLFAERRGRGGGGHQTMRFACGSSLAPPNRGSVDTTKTRSGPQRVRMSSGERPIGAAKGKQSDTEALCQTPPPLSEPTTKAPPPFGSRTTPPFYPPPPPPPKQVSLPSQPAPSGRPPAPRRRRHPPPAGAVVGLRGGGGASRLRPGASGGLVPRRPPGRGRHPSHPSAVGDAPQVKRANAQPLGRLHFTKIPAPMAF